MSPAAHSNQDEDSVHFAMQLGTCCVFPMVLKSVIELDVLDIIAQAGPAAHLSPSEIASHLPTQNPDAPSMLDRMLRLLAAYSVIQCSHRTLPDGKVERLYGLTPVCKFLTKKKGEGLSLASQALMNMDEVFMQSWFHLDKTVLQGGIPFNNRFGMPLFEYLGSDLRFSKIFHTAMSDLTSINVKKFVETYKGFDGLTSLVDVGGGIGTQLHMIVSKYPHIRGTNFDLPEVVENAPTYQGVQHVGGDMFESVPKGEAILIKGVCHNWNDEECVKLFKNCNEALPENGKLILAEYLLPEVVDSSAGTKIAVDMDMLMLTLVNNGKERTKEEFEALGKAAGFNDFQVVLCAYHTYIMELRKN